mgnify:CR=1 FL=1|jgi:hypothetical protein
MIIVNILLIFRYFYVLILINNNTLIKDKKIIDIKFI